METKKKGIIIFLVFLSVLGISYIYLKKDSFVNSESDGNTLTQKEIDDSLSAQLELEKELSNSSTINIDGKYFLYDLKKDKEIGEFEFNSGSITYINENGQLKEFASFKIESENSVDLNMSSGGVIKYSIRRNDNNEIVGVGDEKFAFIPQNK